MNIILDSFSVIGLNRDIFSGKTFSFATAQDKIYNRKLNGASLEGKVLDVKGQLVKLHLNIDKEQTASKA